MTSTSIGADLFRQTILSAISVDKSDMEQILSCFRQIKINKRDVLVKENTFVHQYYFLEKGLLRLVYHTKDSEETSWVILDGSLFTEIISLKSKQRTNMRIEALEPSIVLCIDEADLNSLCEKIIPFEKFLRLTWEENLYRVIQMKLLQQFSSAKERYDILIQDKNLMQRIPQKYLASILGITPYSLSRLRRQQKS
jgi:CRP/FNR family transcriptional regulator, anaerobic regulatory protein